MALQFLDGFDSIDVYGSFSTTLEDNLKLKYADADTTLFGNSPGLVYDRFNIGLALGWNSDNSKWIEAPVTGSPSTLIIGFAVKTPRYTTMSQPLIQLRNASDGSIYVLYCGGYNNLYCGTVSTPTIWVDKPLVRDTWYYIEWKVFVHQSAGTLEIRVNGVQVASETGIDTESAAGPVTRVRFWAGAAGAILDDIYIVDNTGTLNTYLGPGIVESLTPNADTLENDFAPASGPDNYAMIDEIPCDLAATYIEASPTGYKDRCDYPNLSEIDGDALAVMVWTVAAATSGSYTLKVSSHDGTTRDTDTGSTVNSTSYAGFLRTMDQTPSAASWSVALVNGSSFGSEVG